MLNVLLLAVHFTDLPTLTNGLIEHLLNFVVPGSFLLGLEGWGGGTLLLISLSLKFSGRIETASYSLGNSLASRKLHQAVCLQTPLQLRAGTDCNGLVLESCWAHLSR